MTVFTGSMSPWCCRRKECIKAITPVSDPLSSLSLLAIVVALLCYPKHFSATSINASVNGDLNWSTSTSSSFWQSLLSPSWIGHPKGMLVYGNARTVYFLCFFRWKKVWQHRPRLFTVLYFSVRSSRSSVLWAAILHECQNYLGG